MFIKSIEFEQILKVWTQHLWADRQSDIQPASSMLLGGGYDVSIHSRYKPIFLGAMEGDKLIGVNSGHQTTSDSFRSRGLYVFPEYRGRGIGLALLQKACELAQEAECQIIWSAPRVAAAEVYKRAGFVVEERELNEGEGFEFGPNLYAQKKLKP